MNNPFFKNTGPFKLSDILKECSNHSVLLDKILKDDYLISDVKNLNEATSTDITFFHSIKYKDLAINTKAYACITKSDFFHLLPNNCVKIDTKDILLLTALITAKFYPDSITDINSYNLLNISEKFKDIISGKKHSCRAKCFNWEGYENWT